MFLAAGVVNGVLYAVGGWSNGDHETWSRGDYVATVEAYDPATDMWETKASMPTARGELAVGVVNGVLYAIGGRRGDPDQAVFATVEAYDPATDMWTTKAPMPTARRSLAVGVVDGILYAVGGVGSDGHRLGTLEAYDPVTDTWTTLTDMHGPRSGLAVAVLDGKIYAVGGGELTAVEVYDPAADTWTLKAPMPTNRVDLAASAVNGILYAVGGGGYSGIVEAYDPVSDGWSTKTPMPTGRNGLATGVVHDILYAVGGYDGLGVFARLEAYDPAADSPSAPPVGECASPPAGAIWCDDFEVDRLSSYFEIGSPTPPNTFARTAGAGVAGSYGMRAVYTPGAPDAGNLKLAFGRNPDPGYVRPVDGGTADYRDIYWRVYVKNQAGWTGGGAALASAMVLATPSWAQAAVGNVWTETTDDNYLTLDPVRGTDSNGQLVTTQYNDFANFTWLGSARGTTPLFDGAHVGQWYCVEAHMKLNDASQANGVLEFWVDGTLDAQRSGLDFAGSYDAFGINALLLENYWDSPGAPATEERYYDNLVVGTQRIGCGLAPSP